MTDKYPRLSDEALRILAACGDVPLTTKEIGDKANVGGKKRNLTAWVGAYDREKRAQWKGKTRDTSYWALRDINDQGEVFTASLVDLGYVELGKSGRSITMKITPEGKRALAANDEMADAEGNTNAASNDSVATDVDVDRLINEAVANLRRLGGQKCTFREVIIEARRLTDNQGQEWTVELETECQDALAKLGG